MKKSIIWIVLVVTTFSSCMKKNIYDEEKQNYGSLEFSVIAPQDLLKSAENITHALISVQDKQGNSIYSLEKIQIYSFNDVFISEPVSLVPGLYDLSEFLLLDENGTIVYACPKIGSPKAYLIQNPLPIEFLISKDNVTKVETEVLSTKNSDPEDFGYATFSFNIVETFDFQLGVFVYDETSENFVLTSAQVTLENGSEELFNQVLDPITNVITLPDDYPEYTLTIQKSGYQSYQYTFSNDSLKSHTNDPLEIILLETTLPGSGLVAYYPFDGNAQDMSGNNNHGTNVNGLYTEGRRGDVNGAITFPATDNYVILPRNVIQDDPFSVSAWFKLTTDKYGQTIIGDYIACSYSGNGFSLLYYGSEVAGGSRLQLYNAQVDHDAILYFTDLVDNQWHHVVITFSDTEYSMYLDNVHIETRSNGYNPTSVDIKVGISDRQHANCAYGNICNFAGGIDDIKIYNRILSTSEIEALYTEP